MLVRFVIVISLAMIGHFLSSAKLHAGIVVSSATRHAHQWLYSSDTSTGTQDRFFGYFDMTGTGTFDHSNTFTNSLPLASGTSNFSHQSVLTATADYLNFSGTLSSSTSAEASNDGVVWHYGGTQWSARASADLSFQVTELTHFRLEAQTVLVHELSTSGSAYIALGTGGTFSSPGPSNPDIAAVGKSWGSAGAGSWGHSAPTASGIFEGTLLPGSYEFHVQVVDGDSVSGYGGASSLATTRSATFNLTLSSVPEPSAMLLVGSVVAGFVCRRRKRV